MNPVRDAIWDILNGDSTLNNLATGGIHWRKAPQDTDPPVCIFTKMSGIRTWCFDGSFFLNEIYLVKGVGFADDAEDIDLRCQEILTLATITVADRTVLLKPMPNEDISMQDQEYGENYDHEGTMYRVITENE